MPDEYELSDMFLDEISFVPSGDNKGARVVIAKADPNIQKVSSRVYPSLERKPGKQNWVDQAGGLPSYIERIAKHLHYEQGMSIGHAIASAVNQVKKWAAGVGNVKPDTRAKAAAALAQWEAKKVKARVKKEEWIFEDLEKGEHHAFTNENAKTPGKDTCDKCGRKAKAHDVKRVRKTDLLSRFFEFAKNDGEFEEDEAETLIEEVDLDPAIFEDEQEDISQEETELPETKKTTERPEIKKDDLDPEVVAYIEALETQHGELTTKVADLTKSVEELSKSDDENKNKLTPEQEALSKADPVLRGLIEKAQKDAEESQKIAKAERDARVQREMISKAETLPMISTDKNALAGILREISDKLEAETVEKLDTLLKAANNQIAEGNLFKSSGLGGGDTTVSSEVEGRAQQIMKNDPKISRDEAIVRVYQEDPKLYAQSQEA